MLLLLELVHFGAKFGPHKSGRGLFQQVEKFLVFDHGHLNDFSDAVTKHSVVKRAEESSVGQSQYRRMIGTVQVLEAKPVAAGARRGSCVYARHNAGAKHDVRSVTVVQSGGKAGDVGDHPATDDQDRLVPRDAVLLERNQNVLDRGDVFVDLVAGEH